MRSSSDVHPRLLIDPPSLTARLEFYLQDVVTRHFGFERVVLGLSGGVDSAVVAYLCARAFGAPNVLTMQLPYKELAREERARAALVIDALGVQTQTLDISPIVDAYATTQPEINWHRLGNVQARVRSIVLFDKLTELGTLPIGTSNRTEILFGYFTQGGDDLAQVNPIADLYKTQVRQLARYLGVPAEIIGQVPTAGLEPGQTDEADFGFSYAEADLVLAHLEAGYTDEEIITLGVGVDVLEAVRGRVLSTARKRVGRVVPEIQPTGHRPVGFIRRSGQGDG